MNNSDTNGELQGSPRGRCGQPANVTALIEVQRRCATAKRRRIAAIARTHRADPE